VNWTLAEAAKAIGAVMVGDGQLRVGGVSTNSRSIQPGDLFVAIAGSHHDGHGFVEEALMAGAVGVVVASQSTQAAPRLEVTDTLVALRDLAAHRRDQLEVPVIGITGSSGKTSTKDLTAAVLDAEVWSSPQSYNNEIGVPLTILATPPHATGIVVEVGSRGLGHIRYLAPAIRPTVAVITNIGKAHLETFGDQATVLAAKWELVEGLPPDGVAVLPADDDRFPACRNRVMRFGTGASADVEVQDVKLDAEGRPIFRLAADHTNCQVRLGLAGLHQATNAAAAAAVGLTLGLQLPEIASRLQRATGAQFRMAVHRGRFTVIDDTYNANPDSVAAALRSVAAFSGRRVAVLGLMAELGESSSTEHAAVGRLARELGFELVVVGEDPGFLTGAGNRGYRAEDAAAALDYLTERLAAGDVVLVKGSRVAGMELLAAQLIEVARP